MSDLKVTDRRWWAQADAAPAAEEPKLKPTYIEELETRLTAKDAELQQILSKYRGAAEEFDQARARLRKEIAKDVERGRRQLIVSFLEVLDNLDRALDAVNGHGTEKGPVHEAFVQGVSLVRQQFLTTLDGFGVTRVDPVGQPFDPLRHEAVAATPASDPAQDGLVVGVVRPGYLIGDEVLRPAQVAVARRAERDASLTS
jgi:molecular chaperone GrpE